MFQGRMNAFIILASLSTFGCGGGGGGGGGKEPVVVPPPIEPPVEEPISYDGLRSDAALDTENIAKFVDLIFDGDSTINPLENLISPQFYATAAVAINEPIDCTYGSAVLSGSLDDTNLLGTVTATFDECYQDGLILSGLFEMTIEEIDPALLQPTDFTIRYDNLSISTGNSDLKTIFGTQVVRGEGSCDASETINIIVDDLNPDNSYMLENMVIRHQCDENSKDYLSLERRSFSGAIYIASLGKVTLNGQDLLFAVDIYDARLSRGVTDFLVEGELTISNSSATAIFTGRQDEDEIEIPDRYFIHVLFDQHNDGVYQIDASVPSSWLVTQGMMDMSDGDNDGMWRGWEVFYSLDPSVNDASEDPDKDGFTNYQEFITFYSPNSKHWHPGGWLRARSDRVLDKVLAANETSSNEIYLDGKLDQAFIANIETLDVMFELGTFGGNWQFESTFNCQLIEDTENIGDILNCFDIPSSLFSDLQDNLPIVKLTVTAGNDLDLACPYVSLLTSVDLDIESNLLCYSFAGKLLAPALGSPSKAYLFSELDEQAMRYPIYLTDQNYIFAFPETVTVSGQLVENSAGIDLLGVDGDTEFRSPDCELIDAERFQCSGGYADVRALELSYLPATQVGTATIRWEITAQFAEGYTRSSTTERVLAFGLPSIELQELIDSAIVDNEPSLDLPSGNYIGPLSVSGDLSLNGGAGTILWLTKAQPGSTLSTSYSFETQNAITVQNMTFHVADTPLVMSGGILHHNTFYDVGFDTEKFVVVDSATYQDFTANANHFHFIETNIEESQFYYHRAAIEAEANYDSEGCECYLTNNLVEDLGVGLSFFDDNSYQPSANSSIIANNTLINVDHLLNHYIRDGSHFLIVNNLYYRDSELPSAKLLNLTINSNDDYSKYVDFRSNLVSDLDALYINQNILLLPTVTEDMLIDELLTEQAIDAGEDMSELFNSDIMGRNRPIGAGFDIGAYERQQ
ncbi:hypothetical protein EZV61_07055 [Corallincola luteus]|uniref:Right handed beta helix domain-containing protein n=1 Tax=Corallincola luteus TaxID=1775177 RepID=A0ABY2AQ93_9GAMM|nr:choice-of-anchor Q domain-containing protein [Corallincola luteus]TCI03947.1 hypothetical protein EZV61_07055 [Corallincola luteus]